MGYREYMRTRQEAFTTYNRDGYQRALAIVKDASLDHKEHAGLLAELDFYNQYRHEYHLTLSADCGDSCDFSGSIDGAPVRIDVTTNIDFKNILHYTKESCKGFRYLIAERRISATHFTFYDAWELAGVSSSCRCSSCQIPFALIFPEGTSNGGSPDGWNRIALLSYCPACDGVSELKVFDGGRVCLLSDYRRLAMDYYMERSDGEPDSCYYGQVEKDCRTNLHDLYHYLKMIFDGGILAIGEYRYITTDPKGDGYYGIQMEVVSPCVKDILPEQIEYDGKFVL